MPQILQTYCGRDNLGFPLSIGWYKIVVSLLEDSVPRLDSSHSTSSPMPQDSEEILCKYAISWLLDYTDIDNSLLETPYHWKDLHPRNTTIWQRTLFIPSKAARIASRSWRGAFQGGLYQHNVEILIAWGVGALLRIDVASSLSTLCWSFWENPEVPPCWDNCPCDIFPRNTPSNLWPKHLNTTNSLI